MRALVLMSIFLLASCSGQQQIKYPAQTSENSRVKNKESNLTVARSAFEFKDKDIVVPANFEPQGLQHCTFEKQNESALCPLKKPVIRVYFDGNNNETKHSEEATAIAQLDNHKLELILESQLAGINRFQIVTQDQTTAEEIKQQLKEQSAKEVAQQLKSRKTLRPDYLLKIDTVKTADRFYAEYNGMAQYSIELTASMIDPYTKEKLAYPNVGKVRVFGTDIKPKQELVYTEVSGRYYTGFDYTNEQNVQAIFNQMASKAFDILLARLLTEMPTTAQVQAFKNGQITLDRGRNAGLLNQDTVILFQYDSGFVDPIAVATVTPSSESAIGQIVRWKNNKIADDLKKRSKSGIVKSTGNIFAVTTGLPKNYLKTRM